VSSVYLVSPTVGHLLRILRRIDASFNLLNGLISLPKTVRQVGVDLAELLLDYRSAAPIIHPHGLHVLVIAWRG